MGETKEVSVTTTRRTKVTVVTVAVNVVAIGVLYCAAGGDAFSPSPPQQRPLRNCPMPKHHHHHHPSSSSISTFLSLGRNTRHYFKAETEEEKTAALEIQQQQQQEEEAAQKQKQDDDDGAWQEQEKVERMATFLSSRLGMAFLKAKKEEQYQQQQKPGEVVVVAEEDASVLKTEVEKGTANQLLEKQELEANQTKADASEKESLDSNKQAVEDEVTMEEATANPLENLELIIEKAAAASGKDEDFEKSLQRGMPQTTEPQQERLQQQQQQQDETTVTPLEMPNEQEASVDSAIKDKEIEDERPVPLHQKEGDRVVALKDEFATGEAVVPPVVSTSFGRPLEVIEVSVPPLRTNPEKSSPSSPPPTMTDKSTEDQQHQGSESSPPLSSSLKAMPVVVDRENDMVASAVLPDSETKPDMLDVTKTASTEFTESSTNIQEDVDAPARLPTEEVRQQQQQQQQRLIVQDAQPEPAQTETPKADSTTTPDLVVQKDAQVTYQTPADLIAKKVSGTDKVTTTTTAAATTMPVPNEKTKDSSQALAEKAFAILLSLGMITITPDPQDPDYDHSRDDELCPENKWKQ